MSNMAGLEGTPLISSPVNKAEDGSDFQDQLALEDAGEYFVHSVAAGLEGMVERPKLGFQRDGIAGAVTGTVKGFVGLVAAPFTGA